MATKKKSTNNNNLESKSEEIENSVEVEQKIELITSTDPDINKFSDNLQSEIDLFESELNESLVSEKFDDNEPEKTKAIEPDKQEEKEPEIIETKKTEDTKSIEREQIETKESEEQEVKKSKKSRSKSTKKTKSKEPDKSETSESEEQEAKKSKKSRSKSPKKIKSIEPEKTDTSEPEVQKEKEADKLKSKTSPTTVIKEEVKNVVKEEIIDINLITEVISDPKIQASVLSVYNENAELKASFEKAKKMLRILKKKLDLAEEKEEQWRLCAHNLGDIFAEKSHMPLEDVLRRFEAPIEESEI